MDLQQQLRENVTVSHAVAVCFITSVAHTYGVNDEQ